MDPCPICGRDQESISHRCSEQAIKAQDKAERRRPRRRVYQPSYNARLRDGFTHFGMKED